MSDQKSGHLEKLKNQLHEWNEALNRLEAETKKATADERFRYEKMIKALREKEAAVKETLGRILDVREDAWDEIKHGMESAWSSLKGSLKAAKTEFERGLKEGMEEKPGKED